MVDILVLGATGFTGSLIVRCLHNHRQRASFTFGIGVRSVPKGEALKTSVGISENDGVPVVQVDLSSYDTIEAAVKDAKVILNVAGPYWIWGADVVKACAAQGKRYVDLTGEPHFIRRIIDQYESLATKTGAIIVPACGFDSIPPDLLVYNSNRTIKETFGADAKIGLSQTFYDIRLGVSGGSFATLMTGAEQVPRATFEEAASEYALSRVKGHLSPPARIAVQVPFTSPATYAGFWVMATMNRCVVQRSFGLNEFASMFAPALYKANPHETQRLAYGPQFRYEEYRLFNKGWLMTALITLLMRLSMTLLFHSSAIRWLAKKVSPRPGEGPSEKAMAEGMMNLTNFTECASSPGVYARSIMRGSGDPGYLLTAHMIVECAIALVLDNADLPSSSHLGGILTPSTAFGDVLAKRLEATGLMHFESQIVSAETPSKPA